MNEELKKYIEINLIQEKANIGISSNNLVLTTVVNDSNILFSLTGTAPNILIYVLRSGEFKLLLPSGKLPLPLCACTNL